jgi:hypothetical protein
MLLSKNRKDRLEKLAEDINRISLDYHLTHAIFACNQYLRESYKTEREKAARSLRNQLKESLRGKNAKEQKALLEKNAHIEQTQKFSIYVEYARMPIYESRVIKGEGWLVISLSGKLLEDAPDKDNLPVGEKLRKTTAHELGHAILHSKDMKHGEHAAKEEDAAAKEENAAANADREQEADAFAQELLNLRHQRNEALFKSGAY